MESRARSVYTVGQVASYIRNMFEQDFMLKRIFVSGEVSNCKYHTSGHLYFTLKDVSAAIDCVMFARARRGLAFPMKNGDKVIVEGSINVYEKDGRCEIYARSITRQGRGLLYERYLRLKEELEEMGMFAQEYKKPIPAYVQRLGVVTAPTGAAIRDIQTVSLRRNPYIQIILYPALVQGDGAAASIVRGIQMLDALGLDVLIVGRGGGSVEELWAFNEEAVARAIFECRTPVISAVGHETDVTIADFVADLRAPTPSVAAELAVKDIRQVLQGLSQHRIRMNRALSRQIQMQRERLRRYQLGLVKASPAYRLRDQRQRLMDAERRLGGAMEGRLTDSRHRMELYVSKFQGLSPLNKLNQGYSYVEKEGRAVRSVRQVQTGDLLQIHVSDGTIQASVQAAEAVRRGENGG